MSFKLHHNLNVRAVVDSTALPWVSSPATGVQRRMMERVGGETARATSVVRYAAGSRFDLHQHEFGEEIFVLDGQLFDELGSYGPGTYIKNPPGSWHAPYSLAGCTLFVKLRHLAADDAERVVVDSHSAVWYPGRVSGLTVLPLAEFGSQHTALVRWAPGTAFNRHRHFAGEEIFVIDGTFEDDQGRYAAGTWLRSPHLSEHTPFSRDGCTILVKTGHLPAQSHPTHLA